MRFVFKNTEENRLRAKNFCNTSDDFSYFDSKSGHEFFGFSDDGFGYVPENAVRSGHDDYYVLSDFEPILIFEKGVDRRIDKPTENKNVEENNKNLDYKNLVKNAQRIQEVFGKLGINANVHVISPKKEQSPDYNQLEKMANNNTQIIERILGVLEMFNTNMSNLRNTVGLLMELTNKNK